MGKANRLFDHPAIGKLAVCQRGRIGLVDTVIRDHKADGRGKGRFLYVGRRLADGLKWCSRKPIFLAKPETARIHLIDDWCGEFAGDMEINAMWEFDDG